VVDGVEFWASPEQCRIGTDHLYWSVVRKADPTGSDAIEGETSWTRCVLSNWKSYGILMSTTQQESRGRWVINNSYSLNRRRVSAEVASPETTI
jgi:hypothetical protein